MKTESDIYEPATQQHLAELLGMHRSTVSLALRNDPRVNERTRRRVGEAASRLGYRPHHAARSLVTRRTHAIGFIMGGAHLSPFDFIGGYADALRALSTVLQEHEYHLLLAGEVTHSVSDEQRIMQSPLLATHLVDALLVMHPPASDLEFRIRQLGLPYVVLDAPPRQDCCCVGRDEKKTAEYAVDHLAALGHRRIALFGFGGSPPVASLTTEEPLHPRREQRVSGYLEAMARLGLPPMYTWEDRRPLAHRVDDAFRGDDRPTAILLYDSNDAAVVASRLREQGLNVPRDVSLIALHPFTGLYERPSGIERITCFDNQQPLMGKLAAQKLLEYTRNPGRRPASVVLDPVLGHGQTVGPIPQSAQRLDA